jgi:hypothetical protein
MYVEVSSVAEPDAEVQNISCEGKKIGSEVVQRIAILHVVMVSSIGVFSVKAPALLRKRHHDLFI